LIHTVCVDENDDTAFTLAISSIFNAEDCYLDYIWI